MAKNTGRGHRRGLIRGRFQKFNPISKLWDKYDYGGNYLGSKKTGGLLKRSFALWDVIQSVPSDLLIGRPLLAK